MQAAAGPRLRARRRELGLSLRELGSRVGVSASMLSQVENDRCRASVATLYKLVNELGLTLDDLFENPAGDPPAASVTSSGSGQPTPGPRAASSRPASAAPRGPVLVPGERVTIELESGVTWEKLSNAAPAGLEFILVTYAPGSSSGKSGKFSQHQGFECAYIESGELTFHHMFDTWTLHPGDTVTFDASEPHRLENRGTEDVRAVWVILREAAASASAGAAPAALAAGAEGLAAAAVSAAPRATVVRGS
ncbi:helix-turn-helix domain-containing protein [Longivirga aurantiaca]|uniref:Helix-turn-helix domain-containing protein n=1 Tax=Longivirga aurantiaca TaxID=1837743 RepID=A0ABW1T0D8_9ACTN